MDKSLTITLKNVIDDKQEDTKDDKEDVKKVFLIYGGDGWIGSMLVKLLQEMGHTVIHGNARLQFLDRILLELRKHKPHFVLNVAGITGNPTIDWCEDHKDYTFLINTVGVYNLAYACSNALVNKTIHLTNYASGCIYKYDEDHPMYSNIGFTENDPPNFNGSTYSQSKVYAEQLLKVFDNVLTLRIRLPITADSHPKNLINKIVNYQKVVNIPNSISILPELLPISIDMTLKKITGVYNFVNSGVITHNEILSLYKKYVDPDFKWTNFTIEEQNKFTTRSHCHLDTTKLSSLYPITDIHDALSLLMQSYH